MAIEVPDLVGKVRLDTSGLDRAVSEGSRKGALLGSAIGSAVGNLAAEGISRAVDAVGEFITGGIAAASDLSESTSKVGVVFGAASQSVLDFASTSAKALGQSEAQVLGATGTFGNLLRAVGLSEQQSAKFSTSMVQLATDLASFNNTDPTEALEALRSGLVGETEPLKRFGVNMNEATLKAKAMELGLSDGKGVLDSNAKAQAAYALIMEQTALAQGDFARTSGGLANQQRIFGAQMDDLQAKLGGLLLPVITRVVSALNAGLGPAVDTVSQAFAGLRAAFDVIATGDFSGGIFGLAEDSAVVDWLFRAHDALEAVKGAATLLFTGDFTGGIGGLGEDSAPVDFLFDLRDAAVSFADTLRGLGEQALGVFSGIAVQIGPVVQGLAARLLPALTNVARTVVDTVIPTVQGLIATFVETALPVIQSVAGFIMNNLVPVLATVGAFIIGTVVPAVLRFAADVAERLQPIIRAVGAFITGTLVPNLQRLTATFMEVWPSIQKVIVVVGKVLGFLGRLVASVLGAVIPAILRFAGPVFGALFGAIGFGIRLIGAIIEVLFGIGRAVASAVSGFGRLVSAIRDRIGDAVGVVRDLPRRVRVGIGNASVALYSAGRDLLQGLINGIKDKVGAAVRAVRDAVSNVIGGAKRLLGIASPSKVFTEIGQDTFAGMVVGLERMAPRVKRAVEDGLYVPDPPTIAPVLAGVRASAGLAGVPGAGATGAPVNVRLVVADGMAWLKEFVRVEVDGFATDLAAGVEAGVVV